MEKINICLTKIKKPNKNKLEQSKKHKSFSNVILNKYNVNNNENDNIKDIFHTYYDKHKKKFDNFTVCVMWMNNGLVVNKVSVSRIFTHHQIKMRLTIIRKQTACDFLNKYNQDYVIDEIKEFVITFISDLKDMTFSLYTAQPKSMLCRKLGRNFFEEDFGYFQYNWLPNCFIQTKVYFLTL